MGGLQSQNKSQADLLEQDDQRLFFNFLRISPTYWQVCSNSKILRLHKHMHEDQRAAFNATEDMAVCLIPAMTTGQAQIELSSRMTTSQQFNYWMAHKLESSNLMINLFICPWNHRPNYMT